VQAESAGEGRGSTFTLVLPLIARARESPPPLPVMVAPEVERLDGLTVLLLDAEAGAREQLAAMLAQLGAGVELVATLEEAEATLSQMRVDVVVSDVSAADGAAFIRRLRAQTGRVGLTPVIALSMEEPPEGYDMHVAKPVDARALARAIVQLARLGTAGDTERIVVGDLEA
jgi:CheY-like chemotaxis protein